MVTKSLEKRHTVSYKPLLSILFIAFLLRLYLVITYSGIIENDGAEYATIAENLLKGKGYIGTSGDTQLVFPPLYPILIATFSLVTGNSESAARLVSLIMGTCLVLPMFFIASHLYGRRVAYIAASLVGFHPLLISLSGATYSESTFLPLMMGGVYWGLRSLELKNLKNNVLSGICFGLAYLTRPDAFIYPFLTVVAIFFVAVNKKKLRKAAIGSLCLLLSFILLSAPYIAFISVETGHFRLEGKSDIHYVNSQRINSGMSFYEAAYGIDKNLGETGTLLNPNSFISHSSPISFRDFTSYLFANLRRNIAPLFKIIVTSTSLSSPLLIVLVVIGIFRTSISRLQERYILLIASFILLILLSAERTNLRFTLPLLPFMILGASKGIEELSNFVQNTVIRVKLNLLTSPKQIRSFVPWFLSMILVLVAMRGSIAGEAYKTSDMFEQAASRYLPVKEAGLWLNKYRPGPKKIMELTTAVPYYAHGTMLPFPYAEPSLILKYIHHKNPDFVVLDGPYVEEFGNPALKQWSKNGIPDESADLIYTTGNTPEEKIMIYQWNSLTLLCVLCASAVR